MSEPVEKKHKQIEVCCICMDDYTDTQVQKEQLVCGHAFHLECIKSVRRDCCPLCRAPLEGPHIGEAEVRRVRTRYVEDVHEINAEAGYTDDCVPIGSVMHQNALRVLLEQNTLEQIDNIHDMLHHGCLAAGSYECEVVDAFVEDIYECLCKGDDEEEVDYSNREVLQWFCERLMIMQRNQALHQAAHVVFDTVPCAHLHQYALIAHRVLVGAELLRMALRDKKVKE